MITKLIIIAASMSMFFIIFISASLAEGIDSPCIKNQIISHSGGTDKCGCHYNRKTKKYHCHTRKQRGGSCPS